MLLGEEIHNTAVVVTRYFGGTLLGTGGLVRAYSGAVKAGLEASKIITKTGGLNWKYRQIIPDLAKYSISLDRGGLRFWILSMQRM